MASICLRRLTAAVLAVGLLACGSASAADSYRTNLGPMPLDEAVNSTPYGALAAASYKN
jgi:hypothetical protein